MHYTKHNRQIYINSLSEMLNFLILNFCFLTNFIYEFYDIFVIYIIHE